MSNRTRRRRLTLAGTIAIVAAMLLASLVVAGPAAARAINVRLGTPHCGTGNPVHNGKLTFTIATDRAETYHLEVVSPENSHGYDGFSLPARTEDSYTLAGIPDGVFVVTVKRKGSNTILFSRTGIRIDCTAPGPRPVPGPQADTGSISFGCNTKGGLVRFEVKNERTTRAEGYQFSFTDRSGITHIVGKAFGLDGKQRHGDYNGSHNGFPVGLSNGRITGRIYRGNDLIADHIGTIDCAGPIPVPNPGPVVVTPPGCEGFNARVGFPIATGRTWFECKSVSSRGNFEIFYMEGTGRGKKTKDEARHIGEILETERTRLISWGFRAPVAPIPVYVYDRGNGESGYSPPGRIELKSEDRIEGSDFLRHELFHQFQWEYSRSSIPEAILSLDWIEGQAEWAACPVRLYGSVPAGHYCNKNKSAYYWAPSKPAPRNAVGNYSSVDFYRQFESKFGFDATVELVKAGQQVARKMWETRGFTDPCPAGSPRGWECSNWLHFFRTRTPEKYRTSLLHTRTRLETDGGAGYWRLPTNHHGNGSLEIRLMANSGTAIFYSVEGCRGGASGQVADTNAGHKYRTVNYSGCTSDARLVVTNYADSAFPATVIVKPA